MSRTTAFITSDHPKGRQFADLCRAAYNKARLNDNRAQRLNERGGELRDGVLRLIYELSQPNRFIKEEVSSDCTYPKGYSGPKPVVDQINTLATTFRLSPEFAMNFVEKTLPVLRLHDGAEGWFAVPSVNALATRFFPKIKDEREQYCRAVNLVLSSLGESHNFTNFRSGLITPNRFRLSTRTAWAIRTLTQQQKGDILIVGGQFGRRFSGCSPRRASEIFVRPEFGGYTVAVGSMLLTHPDRCDSDKILCIDIPGDECKSAQNKFDSVPYFNFLDGSIEFLTNWLGDPEGYKGSVSLFLPTSDE